MCGRTGKGSENSVKTLAKTISFIFGHSTKILICVNISLMLLTVLVGQGVLFHEIQFFGYFIKKVFIKVSFTCFIQIESVLHLSLTQQIGLVSLDQPQQVFLNFCDPYTQIAFQDEFCSFDLHFHYIRVKSIICLPCLSLLQLFVLVTDNLADC